MKAIDQLKTIKTGQRLANSTSNLFKFTHETLGISPHTIDTDILYEYVTGAELKFIQLGRDNHPDEARMLAERAAIAIAHELYGEVVEKLFDIRTKLWQSGPRYDDEITIMIGDLIDELQLRKD